MGTPYKMKYTNGKKADPTAFPFNTMQQEQPTIESTQRDEAINNRVNQVVEKKVNSAIDEDVQTGDSAFKQADLTPDQIDAAKKKAKRKAIGDVLVSSITGGLDAVYGSGRVSSLGGKIKFSKDKKDDDKNDDKNA